jgi:curved DNA-binding protein CbpA
MKNQFLTYYDLLGVGFNASTDEILKAFRVKAKEHHPDKNQGNQSSNTLFQYIQNEKEVLSDPVKRLEYDYVIGVKKRQEQRRVKSDNLNSVGQAIIGGAVVGLIVGLFVGALASGKDVN